MPTPNRMLIVMQRVSVYIPRDVGEGTSETKMDAITQAINERIALAIEQTINAYAGETGLALEVEVYE